MIESTSRTFGRPIPLKQTLEPLGRAAVSAAGCGHKRKVLEHGAGGCDHRVAVVAAPREMGISPA